MVYGSSLNVVEMVIPPGIAATVRAELPGLLFWSAFNGFSTLLAAHCVFPKFTIQPISAAKGANCIIRDTKNLADFYISNTL